jgi:benzoyl-CoA 2,3-epoxidase subunit B
MLTKLRGFDDWVDLFQGWRRELGLDHPAITGQLETKFSPASSAEVEFGDFAGRRKWERVLEIPSQAARDLLEQMIVVQADTEFASNEQQRALFDTAPSEHDLAALSRIVFEEMRHGWQMCHLLVRYFGDSGKLQAQKMLERRAYRGERLLGSFNEPVEHWLDFFTYTCFIDRDGKYQLMMLSRSGFAPLARSIPPMLKEEAFHLGTGFSGLKRILTAGRVPPAIVQRYLNRWIPTAFDLFGNDHSGSAHWAYTFGLKGRFEEEPGSVDRTTLNQQSRTLYREECERIVSSLNRLLPEEAPRLYVPDLRFRRRIGEYAGKTFSVDGRLLEPGPYLLHLEEALPTAADQLLLQGLFQARDWISPKGAS